MQVSGYKKTTYAPIMSKLTRIVQSCQYQADTDCFPVKQGVKNAIRG
jgi:hypothetical protein